MAIIFALGFVLLRPFLEVLPGIMARALVYTGHSEFIVSTDKIDNVYPMLIENLVPAGLKGLLLVGILASVMSTISAFLNSISTLFTYDVYKRWINKNANDKKLVKIGMISTFGLMVFSVLYAPVIGKLGGIFIYFQTVSTYLAVPVATCFLFGMFWKRTTPAATLTIMIGGIPLGLLIHLVLIPFLFSPEVIARYSLTNFYVACGITQFFCALIIVGVSLCTKPMETNQIMSLTWSKELLKLPANEKKRPFWQSVGLWWSVMAIIYAILYYAWW
jgi:solute:Na+ symporter, SSS family